MKKVPAHMVLLQDRLRHLLAVAVVDPPRRPSARQTASSPTCRYGSHLIEGRQQPSRIRLDGL
jgi:hypothetical protein